MTASRELFSRLIPVTEIHLLAVFVLLTPFGERLKQNNIATVVLTGTQLLGLVNSGGHSCGQSPEE